MLVAQGRIGLGRTARDWVAECERSGLFTFLPVDNNVALVSTTFPPIHKDSADRIILATAIVRQIPLVSKDEAVARYPGVEVIW
jgi:PIN domain nuclease of toxin-antitoxin system